VTKDEQNAALMEQSCDTNKRLMVLVENLAAQVVTLSGRSAAAEERDYLPPMPIQYGAPARGSYPPEPLDPDQNGKPQVVETEIPRPEMPEYHPPVVDGANGGPGAGPG
jgi:hypothetical protein